MQNIIIRISRFLSHVMATNIAKARWNTTEPLWVNGVRQSLFDCEGEGYFDVVATDSHGEFAGRLHCIRNKQNAQLWYYGDLFVVPSYRRQGIASSMVRVAMEEIAEQGGTHLQCYVEPDNTPSIALQTSLGFAELPYEPFDDQDNEGRLLFRREVPSLFSVIPATVTEAYFVRILFAQSRDSLECEDISYGTWKELLAADDPDEEHLLLCKGALPVGYMKLNGLQNERKAWLSMLFVSPFYRRQGVGRFAVKYACKELQNRGFSEMGIQTTAKNLPAQRLYEACGFVCKESGERLYYHKNLQESN